MKKAFKLTVLLLTVLTALIIFAVCVNAEDTVNVTASGSNGNVYWEITSDGVLTISGEGSVPNGSVFGSSWSNYSSKITEVVIEPGISMIGSYSFYGLQYIEKVTIPEGVSSIGQYAFHNCKSMKSLILPGSVTLICKSAFHWCTSLETVFYTGSEADWKRTAIESYNTYLKDAEFVFIHADGTLHEYITHEAKDPTCTEVGWKEYIACEECEYTTYEEIPELGHDEIAHEGKEPTCTESGWAEYVACSRCDYTTYVEIPALGHDYENRVCKVCKLCETGFLNDEDGTRYYYEDGTFAKGWQTIEGKTYRFDGNGILFEGESLVYGVYTYWFGEDHATLEGLVLDADGYRFYKGGIRQYGWVDFDKDGKGDSYFYVSSQLRCEEDRVLFDGVDARRFFIYDAEKGYMTVANGFYTDEKGTQFFKNGMGQYGWITADGISITDKPGITLSDVHYFAYGDGLNFYMVEDSVKTIGGVVREFDENHLAKAYTGWAVNKVTGNENYYVEGVLQQGWCETPDGWVYLSRSENLDNNITYGDVSYGWKKIGGKVYYFRAGTSNPKYVIISDPSRDLTYDGVRETYYINQPADPETATGADYFITNPPAGF